MGEKFKKLELNSEIWGEWGVTYGENGFMGGIKTHVAQLEAAEHGRVPQHAGDRRKVGSGEAAAAVAQVEHAV